MDSRSQARLEKIAEFSIGFLISLAGGIGFVWLARHAFGFGDRSIIVGLVTMYCVNGGREFSKPLTSSEHRERLNHTQEDR